MTDLYFCLAHVFVVIVDNYTKLAYALGACVEELHVLCWGLQRGIQKRGFVYSMKPPCCFLLKLAWNKFAPEIEKT
jgi:hypothetical protein